MNGESKNRFFFSFPLLDFLPIRNINPNIIRQKQSKNAEILFRFFLCLLRNSNCATSILYNLYIVKCMLCNMPPLNLVVIIEIPATGDNWEEKVD